MSHIHIKIQDLSITKELPTILALFGFLRSEILLTLSPFIISVAAAQKVLKKHYPSAEQINEVSKHIDTSIEAVKGINWSLDRSLFLFRKFALPKPEMENATIREFIIADYYLDKYVKAMEGQDPKVLHYLFCLMGSMCRPVSNHSLTDPRTPITSRQQAEAYAAIFERHSSSVLYARRIIDIATICLYTAISTKNFIANNYMPHLNTESGGGGGISFGWDTIVMDVAENGAFGNIKDCYDTGLHDIMIFCVKKAQEFQKAKQKESNL